jgi:hypothetical protein
LDLVCTYLQLSVSIKSGKAFWRSWFGELNWASTGCLLRNFFQEQPRPWLRARTIV